MLFLDTYDRKHCIFGLWTISYTKQVISRCHLGLWEIIYKVIFHSKGKTMKK